MSATLVAKHLSGGHAHRALFEQPRPHRRARRRGRRRRRERRRQDHPAAAARRGVDPAGRHRAHRPVRRLRRLAAAGARAGRPARRSRRTSPGVPARPRPPPPWRPPPSALGSGTPGRRRRLRRAPWTAGWPAAPPTSTSGSRRCSPTSASTSAPDALMTSLSGGQAARAALAALLLSRFDVVLLDEPTNDLDLAGLERLEAFVRGLRGGVVLVSHDREFLARCVNRVVELDLAQNQVAVYDGGYDAFLEERAVARRHAREAYDEFADKKADLVARARTQREWSSPGRPQRDEARAPTTTRSAARRTSSPRRSRPRRSARWSPGSPGSRRSRSRARSGRCSSASASRPALELGGRHPERGVAAARRLRASARCRCRSTRASGSASPAPTAPARPRCCGCCSAGWRPASGTASLGATVAVGEIDQARTGFAEELPLGDAFEAAVPEMAPGRRPHPAGEVRAQGRPGRPAGSAGSRRASAPGPRWRCCRPAG